MSNAHSTWASAIHHTLLLCRLAWLKVHAACGGKRPTRQKITPHLEHTHNHSTFIQTHMKQQGIDLCDAKNQTRRREPNHLRITTVKPKPEPGERTDKVTILPQTRLLAAIGLDQSSPVTPATRIDGADTTTHIAAACFRENQPDNHAFGRAFHMLQSAKWAGWARHRRMHTFRGIRHL
jgi:hypothetical protein